MTIENLLDRITEIKTRIKTNPKDEAAKKEIAAAKSELTKLIDESESQNAVAAIENWLAKHPNETHVEQLLQKLKK